MIVLDGSPGFVESLCFRTDGGLLATSRQKPPGSVEVWEIGSTALVGRRTFLPNRHCYHIGFTAGGRLLAVGVTEFGSVFLDPTTADLTVVGPAPSDLIASDPITDRLLLRNWAGHEEGDTLTGMRATADGTTAVEWERGHDRYWLMLVACGGETIASVERNAPSVGGVGTRLVVLDAATGTVRGQIDGLSDRSRGLAVASAGDRVAVRGGLAIHVWGPDLTDPPVVVANPGPRHFTDLAFHPSGRYLAVTGNDETVKLYDTTTWTLARTFTWQIGRMRSVAFSPDGTLAAAGSDTGKVVVWDFDG